jgi:hypothetical protein
MKDFGGLAASCFFDEVWEGRVLPNTLFKRRFSNYIFFDADLSSSIELAAALKERLKVVADECAYCFVYSASNAELLSGFCGVSLFDRNILDAGKALRAKGDYEGLIVLSSDGAWALHQARPVDIGVFAFNGGRAIFGELSGQDLFFDCADICKWKSAKTKQDLSILLDLGENFLGLMLENYCFTLDAC